MKLYPPQFCILTELCNWNFGELEEISTGRKTTPEFHTILPERITEEGETYLLFPGDPKYSKNSTKTGINRIKIIFNKNKEMIDYELIKNQ